MQLNLNLSYVCEGSFQRALLFTVFVWCSISWPVEKVDFGLFPENS